MLWCLAFLALLTAQHLFVNAKPMTDDMAMPTTPATPTKVSSRALPSSHATADEGDSSEESAADDNAAEADEEKSAKTRSYDSSSSSGGGSSSYGASSSGSSYDQKPEYPTQSYDEEYKDYDKDSYKVGGYGKSTVLKGVKVKVVPWVREGVQYIPKKFYIYGQVESKTPYFKRITTSVQHLGPGKTKYYKETTGVESGETVQKPLPYVDKSSKYWTAATQYNTEYDNSYDTGDSYGASGSSYGGSSQPAAAAASSY